MRTSVDPLQKKTNKKKHSVSNTYKEKKTQKTRIALADFHWLWKQQFGSQVMTADLKDGPWNNVLNSTKQLPKQSLKLEEYSTSKELIDALWPGLIVSTWVPPDCGHFLEPTDFRQNLSNAGGLYFSPETRIHSLLQLESRCQFVSQTSGSSCYSLKDLLHLSWNWNWDLEFGVRIKLWYLIHLDCSKLFSLNTSAPIDYTDISPTVDRHATKTRP